MNWFKLIQKIEINPTELCNLKCSFCPRSEGYPNQNAHISEEVSREIRKQLDESGYDRFISITGRGEPTLTKNFDKILDILLKGDRKYGAYMNTNGKKLEKYEKYIPFFSWINLDVYDVDKSVYEKQKERYSKHKNVIVKYRPDVGIDYGEYNEEFKKDFSNRGGFLKSSKKNNCEGSTCGFVFEKLFINLNGDFNLCCDDWTPTIMSNIYKESIPEYVNQNTKLKEYRESHKAGRRDLLDVCKNCDRINKTNQMTTLVLNGQISLDQ